MTLTAAWIDTLISISGALLFRRRPLRRLLNKPALIKRLPLLFFLLLTSMYIVNLLTGESGDTSDFFLYLLAISIIETAFWLIVLFTVAEPVFDLILRSATFDEVELHWWARWRKTSRLGVLTAFVVTHLVHAISSAALITVPGGDVFAGAIALTWGFFVLRLIIKDWWNITSSQALIIASGTAFVFFTAVFLLLYPWFVSVSTAFVCLAIAPFTMRDISIRRSASDHALRLIDNPDQDDQSWRMTLELLHCAGDQNLAQGILDALHDGERKRAGMPSWALVRLFSAAGQFLEAVDAGIAALDREPNSLKLHLALAEACLGVRDPENAAAHAEQALELAGETASSEEGSEALLLLSLACYNQLEMVSGLHACARVIDCAHHDPSPLLKRIIGEAHMLARRFGTGIEAEE